MAPGALAQDGQLALAGLPALAIDRYFAGPAARSRYAQLASFAALPSDAAVPVFARPTLGETRAVVYAPFPGALGPFGSAYALIDVRQAPRDARVEVWLQGEYGVRWSLGAVRLGADGHPLGTMQAPAAEGPNGGYLPVELDPDTAGVLLVVTNLASGLPAPSLPGPSPFARSFQLIVALRGDTGPRGAGAAPPRSAPDHAP